MRFPAIATTSPFRAWVGGFALAVLVILLPFASALVRPIAFAAFYLTPVGVAVLALYAMTMRPRAFAASGALLGIVPLFAWGVIDGLYNCAQFNRGASGGCAADPTAQVVLMVAVFAAGILTTGLAAWSSSPRPE